MKWPAAAARAAARPSDATPARLARAYIVHAMALTLSQLRKQYVGPDGSVVPVVDIDTFSLADGEQVALVGSSGSGKTTLLHLIAGILTPDAGEIRFASADDGNIDLTKLSEAQRDVFRGRHIGYIFQTHHL